MTSKLASSIKAGLVLKGTTQSALAKAIDVTENTVSNWMQSKNLPDRESLLSLRSYFAWSDEKLAFIVEDWFDNWHGPKEYRIAGHEFVVERYERDYKLFLTDLIKLDLDTVGGLVPELNGAPEQWAPIFESCTTTWRLLLCGGEIAGYWHFVCLKDRYFTKIMNGELLDSEITVDMIDYPSVPKSSYKAYFSIITTRHCDQGPAATRKLLKALDSVLTEFARYGVFMETVGATAFSFPGKQLCEDMGMKYIKRHGKSPDNEVADIYSMSGLEMVCGHMGRNANLRKLYESALT